MTDVENPRAYFTLTFSPCYELVSTVRRYVTEFYETVLGDADMASRVGLATHELLENAVKYGDTNGAASLRVYVTGDDAHQVITVQTTNPAERPDIDRLQSIIARFEVEDREAVYQDMIRASASIEGDSSGLGIARICVEGEMDVVADVEGGIVSVSAKTQLPRPLADQAAGAPGGTH